MSPPTRNSQNPESAPSLPQKKAVACRSCNARKVKCSGTKPCNNCTRASECIYPQRDRQVRVHQSYLDRILKENAELRARQAQSEAPTKAPETEGSGTVTEGPSSMTPARGNTSDDTPEHEIMEESDWFLRTSTSDTPIWIAEISDAAFATRFRQVASSSPAPSHIPRSTYISDDDPFYSATATPPWPSPPRARMLIEAALQFLQKNYHVVRRSEILPSMASGRGGQASRPVRAIKMWALFALGELRASKGVDPTRDFPGLAYFKVASEFARVVHERPQLETVETNVLLALYSLEVNRRHSASVFVSAAMRTATIMGLHTNIGPGSLPDAQTREHRNRVWWTVYVLDRFLSSKVGLPLSISDDDISVDDPSNSSALSPEDFGDHAHFMAVIRLAKIAGNISRSLYVRAPHQATFLQRMESIRQQLVQWKDQLSSEVKVDFDFAENSNDTLRPPTYNLELMFNQLFIIATRPILLFVFRRHISESRQTLTDGPTPESVKGVAEECVRTARRSFRILAKYWVNGEVHTFNYSYVRYLFSAAVILVISSELGQEMSQDDHDEYALAASFLQQLEHNGNFAAMEFCSHIKEIQRILQNSRSQNPQLLAQLPPAQGLGSVTQAPHPPAGVFALGPDGNELDEEMPLDLSFLDDWIYDNAFQQLPWQGE